MGRRIAEAAGAVLLVFGVAVFVTPIPFGALMIGAALVVLVRVSPYARLVRRGVARRYPRMARRLEQMRQRVKALSRRAERS